MPAQHTAAPSSPGKPGLLARWRGMLGLPASPAPGGQSADPRPVNMVLPPWAATMHSAPFLSELEHPNLHAVVQHPNVAHYQRDAASPFIDSAHAANGIRGNAKQQPQFVNGSGGLARMMRK